MAEREVVQREINLTGAIVSREPVVDFEERALRGQAEGTRRIERVRLWINGKYELLAYKPRHEDEQEEFELLTKLRLGDKIDIAIDLDPLTVAFGDMGFISFFQRKSAGEVEAGAFEPTPFLRTQTFDINWDSWEEREAKEVVMTEEKRNRLAGRTAPEARERQRGGGTPSGGTALRSVGTREAGTEEVPGPGEGTEGTEGAGTITDSMT